MAGDSAWTTVSSTSDYYPFGLDMEGRSWRDTTALATRYGVNGKEKDSKGELSRSTTYDFGARIYNPALGKWLSTDPLTAKYVSVSPYAFVANSPIIYIDPDGQRIYFVNANGELVKATKTMIRTLSGLQLFSKYHRSKTEDIYIGVSNFGIDPSAAGLTVSNANDGSDKYGISVQDSKLIINQQLISSESRNAFRAFRKVNFSKSEGKKIHLIAISEDALKSNDEYVNAEIIFHEIKAHIDIEGKNADEDHKLYGKIAVGLYLERLILDPYGNTIPDENGDDFKEVVPLKSPAGQMVQELLILKVKDRIEKQRNTVIEKTKENKSEKIE
jgi:RHS repeat-associated protein